MGGLFWLVSFFVNQLICYISAYLYVHSSAKSEDISSIAIFSFLGALSIVSLLSGNTLRQNMNPAYIHTFYSTQTAIQLAHQKFTSAPDTSSGDVRRFFTFGDRTEYFRGKIAKVF